MRLRVLLHTWSVIRRYRNLLWIFCGDYTFRVFVRHPHGKCDIVEDGSKVKNIASRVDAKFYQWYYKIPQIMVCPYSTNMIARLTCINTSIYYTDALARLIFSLKSTKYQFAHSLSNSMSTPCLVLSPTALGVTGWQNWLSLHVCVQKR